MNGVRASGIPIVDLRDYLAGVATGKTAVAADICAALEGIGFFGIANHGVPERAVKAAFAESQRFFDLPLADKLAVRVNMGHRGYLPMADQHRTEAAKPNLSESYLIGPDLAEDDPGVVEGLPLHGVNPWPDVPDGFQDALGGFHAAMSALGVRLLPLFETALDLPDGFFAARYRNPMGFVRSLHYPPAPAEADPDRFGAAPHSDFGFITILAQDDVGGLQVQTRDGDWIDAPNRPGVFLVNIGDMLMRWTKRPVSLDRAPGSQRAGAGPLFVALLLRSGFRDRGFLPGKLRRPRQPAALRSGRLGRLSDRQLQRQPCLPQESRLTGRPGSCASAGPCASCGIAMRSRVGCRMPCPACPVSRRIHI